jgi:NADH:ubiquinone oxidoreductase subunit F (NADH-binding)
MSTTAAARRSGRRAAPVQRLLAAIRPDLATHLAVHGPVPAPSPGLLREVESAGILGHGGAGFPLARKLSAVSARPGTSVVVANGMEGEPASRKDLALLRTAPHLVIDGAVSAAQLVGADVVHLTVHRGSPAEGALRTAVDERRGRDGVALQVHTGPDRYVASEESALVRMVEGHEAKPTFTPPRPFERGVGGRPTLVSNVETLAHLAVLARVGAAAFAEVGDPGEPGTRLLTVGGTQVLEVTTDTTVATALGQTKDVGAVLVGGFFGTWETLADVGGAPLTHAGLREVGTALGAGVLVGLPRQACGLAEAARIATYLTDHSARQCGPCLNGLPAIASAMHRLAFGGWDESLAPALNRWMGLLPGRGACRHPDGAVRMLASALRTFAADVEHHRRHGPCDAATAPPVVPVPGRLAASAPWR